MKSAKYYSIIVILFFSILFVLNSCEANHTEAYRKYKRWKSGFPFVYSTLDYVCDDEEEKIAKDLIETAKKVFENSSYGEFSEDVGELEKYISYSQRYVHTKCSIELLTARTIMNTGFVWVNYSVNGYDKDNKLVYSCENVLSYWRIKKDNGKWIVTKVINTP